MYGYGYGSKSVAHTSHNTSRKMSEREKGKKEKLKTADVYMKMWKKRRIFYAIITMNRRKAKKKRNKNPIPAQSHVSE
jgi:hypothetical protein